MQIKVSRSKNSCTLYVQKSYRNKQGVSTSKIVERLGSLEEVKVRAGGQDPMEWAKAYALRLTAEEKEKTRTVMLRLSPGKLISKGEPQCFYCGHLFLKQIYYQLGLDRICDRLASGTKIEYDLNDVLQQLVFGRILDPRSKLGTCGNQTKYPEKMEVSLQHVYRALDVLADNQSYIQKRLYKNSLDVVRRDTTVLYYDCTNYFFEAEKADPEVTHEDGSKTKGLRQYGVSKEHRPNPVVQMGMFIDNTGFPLAMCINAGNTNEQVTLIPTEKEIVEGMGVERIVVCTDGGLSSEDNRSFNSTADRSFITVQSLKKLPEAMEKWSLETIGWKLVPVAGANKTSQQLEEEGKLEFDLMDDSTVELYGNRTFYRERWIVNEKTTFSQRLIVTFSYKYRDYLRQLRNREIAVAQVQAKKGTSGKKSKKGPGRFISEVYATSDGEPAVYKTTALNLDAIADEEKYDGFYAICTDLHNPAEEILRLNHNRWESEDAFRVIKTDFKGRPAFVWTDEHIKAHFIVCFIALLIFRILENRLNYAYTSSQILSTLRAMTMNLCRGEGYKPNYTRDDLTDALHGMAGFRTDTEIVTNQKIKQILKIVKES